MKRPIREYRVLSLVSSSVFLLSFALTFYAVATRTLNPLVSLLNDYWIPLIFVPAILPCFALLRLAHLRLALFISSIRRTKPRRSATRKNERPAETATNGSFGPMSVQWSGTEDLRPFVLKKKTRRSWAIRLTLSISNSIFLYG